MQPALGDPALAGVQTSRYAEAPPNPDHAVTHLTTVAKAHCKPQIPQKEEMKHLAVKPDCSTAKLMRVGVN